MIDRRPVSNGEYLDCVARGICPDECQQTGICAGAFYASYHVRDPRLASYPAATVTVAGAEAYCRWQGKRLPTNAEWERAARGAGRLGQRSVAPVVRDSARGVFSPPLATATDDATDEGVALMTSGVPELVADENLAAVYQPGEGTSHGPACPECPRTLRGNLSMGGILALDRGDGSAVYPVPVWMRGAGQFGAFRCAQTDANAPPGYFETRRSLLSGSPIGGAR